MKKNGLWWRPRFSHRWSILSLSNSSVVPKYLYCTPSLPLKISKRARTLFNRLLCTLICKLCLWNFTFLTQKITAIIKNHRDRANKGFNHDYFAYNCYNGRKYKNFTGAFQCTSHSSRCPRWARHWLPCWYLNYFGTYFSELPLLLKHQSHTACPPAVEQEPHCHICR